MIPNKRRIKFLIRIEAKYLKVLSSKSTVLEEGPGVDIIFQVLIIFMYLVNDVL